MTDSKRVVITGATGLIGKALCKELRARGYSLVIFSRNPATARREVPGAIQYVAWHAEEQGHWAAALDGAFAVINLAGASVASKRWTPGYKRIIRDSRIQGTRGLVQAIAQARVKPQVLINASATGYYGDTGSREVAEEAPTGTDFLARLTDEWEAEASAVEKSGVRVVLVRSGIVLDRKEGALPRLLLPFKLFVGGPILPGTQYWPWIHLADEVALICMALENEAIRGPINAVAPQALTNREFSEILGKVLGRPSLVPVPGFALKLLLGEMADIMLIQGQKVAPAKAQHYGYTFQYPELEGALQQTLKTS